MSRNAMIVAAFIVIAVLAIGSYTMFQKSSEIPSLEDVVLQGGGASFPYPQISEWAKRFQEKYGVQIVYQSVGSGAGQSMFLQQAVDFACSDPPLSRDTWKQYNGSILQIPWLFGPVVIVYNIPELLSNYTLRLDAVAIAKIYRGEIVSWNDPYIKALNPEVVDLLPNREIIVVHRSDSSGTTQLFTNFLYKASGGVWTKDLVGKTVNWPVDATGRGVGGKGNEGVTQIVVQTQYSIGYVEWSYAIKNNLRIVAIKNAAGNFVLPSRDTLEEALSDAEIPSSPLDDFSGVLDSVIYASGENSYPILGPTHILIWRRQSDQKKAEALKLFLRWIVEEGYSYLVEGYVAPPQKVWQLLLSAVNLITTR